MKKTVAHQRNKTTAKTPAKTTTTKPQTSKAAKPKTPKAAEKIQAVLKARSEANAKTSAKTKTPTTTPTSGETRCAWVDTPEGLKWKAVEVEKPRRQTKAEAKRAAAADKRAREVLRQIDADDRKAKRKAAAPAKAGVMRALNALPAGKQTPLFKWGASHALTPEHVKKMQVRSVPRAEATTLLDYGAPAGGTCIPFFDINGKPTGFFRIRFDDYTLAFGAVEKNPQRYRQPQDSGIHIYLPPLVDWTKVAEDTSKPILLTEGEAKSAAACAHGYPCIGIPGVTMWGGKKQGLALHPTFAQFKWKGREVAIVFDSDAATNPNVLLQENKLAAEFVNLEARVKVVRLPPDGSKKVGLDDFILAHAAGALQKLIDGTPEWAMSRELNELSARYGVILKTGQVIKYETGQLYSDATFVKVIEAPRKMLGEKGKPVSAARGWIDSKARPEYEALTYVPGQGRVTKDGCLNLWRCSETEPVDCNTEPYEELLEHLIPNPVERNYAEQWVAYPLQTQDRNNTAIVLWGEPQGTGKTILGETFGLLHGRHNYREIKQDELESDFTDWQECKTFIMGSEVSGENGARALADKMKSHITSEFIRVNRKHQPQYDLPNAVNYFLTSNHDNAVFIGQYARRYTVLHAAAPPLPAKFYKDFMRWRDNGGFGALYHRMLTLDLSGYNAKGHALHTEAREEMVAANRTPLQEWVHQLRENTDTALAVGRVTVPGAFFTAEELLSIFAKGEPTKVTTTGLGRALRSAGFKKGNGGDPIRIPKTDLRLYLWIIRDELKAANMTSAEVGEAYWRKLNGTDRFKRGA